ncbi:hypothetical protein BEH_07505 [Priestia filamentosa]|uniref:Uncharacterized protein n=1 Tax=Priestia filamentosa TaxID=1402861 RepID=A0A0H4KUI1_9BACI|nr:hypothetical protein [Priestia filamentosa]AKO91958.1 hypothetical protein BEH_07505 [Priestia filamentosa]
MKQIRSYEVKEFTYNSKTYRNYHVADMEREGWIESGQMKRLKPNVSITDATKDDYEWYAHFQRETT